MKISPHTSGPWAVSDAFIVAPDATGEHPDIYIATIAEEDDEGRVVSFEEQRANAALIIAAPDLLKALEAIHAHLENNDSARHIMLELSRASIAKAKGE